MKSKIYLLISITILFLSCKSSSDNQYELMPLPDIYESQAIDPFENTPEAAISYPKQQILYVTDRAPVDKSSKGYYANERGHVIRLGAAEVMLGKEGMTWDQAKKVSLLKSRPKNYPLQITGVNEYGILGESLTLFSAPKLLVKGEEAGNRFASKVNTELKQSNSKDVFIYIHGYKVPFSNPILVTAELWHFMGYEGCFIAYSWPATPKRTAYFADLETTEYASRNLRLFLKYIAENTDAERIHIVGYSAGQDL